jgi:hypothetical protein
MKNIPVNRRILKFQAVKTIFQLIIFLYEIHNSHKIYLLVIALCRVSRPYFICCYISSKRML